MRLRVSQAFAIVVLLSLGACGSLRSGNAVNQAADFYKQGRYEEALQEYERSIQLTPEYGWAHLGRGNCLVKLGRADEALAAYRRASELLPAESEPAFWLGVVLCKLGRYQEALEPLAKVIAARPTDARPHVQLGIALSRLGETKKALASFEEALRLSPNSMELWPEAAQSYESVRNTVGR